MKNSKTNLRKIALEKIHILFAEAEKNPGKASRYVEIARKIGMRVNLPIPKIYKRRYCRHCNNYFNSKNSRIRTRKKMIVYSCFNCKKYMKFKIT